MPSLADLPGQLGGFAPALAPCAIGHDLIGLVAELGGELAVGGQHLGGGMNLLPVAGGVRGDLRRFVTTEAVALKVLAYLLAAWAGGVKIFLRVPFDLRRAATPRLDLIAEIAEAVGQFGLIDSGGELLAVEETLRLQGAGSPIPRSVILKMTVWV